MPEILSIGELLDLGNSAATAGLIPYSALEYNGSGDISGISGSAIAGGVDTTIVSSIASSYVESGISSKVDQSAFDDCCSSVQSALSGKLDASASGQFAPSGDYVFNSAYSSFTGDTINNISSMSSIVSGLTGDYLDKSASSLFQPSGNYASATDLSSYVPFSGFEYSGSTITAISGSAIGGSQGFEQVQSDWAESASASASFIKHKPTVKPIVAGANISIIDGGSQLTIASLGGGGVPVQANWAQQDSAQLDYIQNKPTGLAPQVQSNWRETSTSSKAYVLNKPTVKPIIAGAGIQITENATAIIISLA